MAKSKSGEFYTFDEVLKQLQIDENRLKRLVSEGEIRAFREGDQMRFKRSEIDTLAGRSGTGGSSSDTSLTEISLEDDSQPTVNVGVGAPDTLADDLAAEPEDIPSVDVSSQDTYIDQGDIGMSTEPIDFTEEDDLGEEAEEIADMGVDQPTRRGAGRPGPAGRPPRPVEAEESKLNVIFVIVLAFAVIAGGWAALVNLSISRGHSNSIMGKAVEIFGSEQE